jgi:hypothetical protein
MATPTPVLIPTVLANAASVGFNAQSILAGLSGGKSFSSPEFGRELFYGLTQSVSFLTGVLEYYKILGPSIAKFGFGVTATDVLVKGQDIIDKWGSAATRGNIKVADILSVIGGVILPITSSI